MGRRGTGLGGIPRRRGRREKRAQSQARGAPLPRPGRRLPGHGGVVFLSLFTALWAVQLLEADERLLAYSRGCWNSGDLEVGGAPTRPAPSTHPAEHSPSPAGSGRGPSFAPQLPQY